MLKFKLDQLGIQLRDSKDRGKSYVGYVRSGPYVYVSGHGPDWEGNVWSGKIGAEYTIEEGYQAARGCALNLLSTLQSVIGDLDSVKQIVKVTGYVNCTEGFANQPEVVNGCSDLLAQLFGEKGRHARAAIGVAALPRNWPVEIEMIVEVE